MNIGYVYILLTTVFFSSMEVALKYTNGVFNPVQINFLRFFIGGLFLLPLAIKKLRVNNYTLTIYDYYKFIFMGFLQIVLCMTLYTLSVAYISAGLVAIIFACNTFFSIIFAFFILKEKIYKSTIIALIFSMIGILTIVHSGRQNADFKGIIICIISAILFSLCAVFSKYFAKFAPVGGVVITSYGFLFGILQLFILILVSRLDFVANFFIKNNLDVFANVPIINGINSSTILPFLFICLGVTGIGYGAYYLAIDNLAMSTVSLIFFIKPVLAPTIAYFILGEKVSMQNMIGLGFITIGSIILFIYSLKRNK